MLSGVVFAWGAQGWPSAQAGQVQCTWAVKILPVAHFQPHSSPAQLLVVHLLWL